VGATTQATASAKDANGNSIPSTPITWSTSNSAIATVTGGTIRGVKAGTAYIKAVSGSYRDSVAVTVSGGTTTPTPVLTSITLTPNNPTIVLGSSQTFTAVGKDQNGNAMTGVSFTWSSSNPGVMSVTNGVVTALTVGLAALNVSSNGVNASTQVTVIASTPLPPPASTGSNEPAGMTKLFFADGTTLDLGPQFNYSAKWTDGKHVVVVPDAAAPRGKAIELRWFAGAPEGGAGAVFWNRFTGYGPKNEIYMRAVFKFSPTWETHPGGNKLWYYGTADRIGSQGAVQMYTSVQPSLNARVTDQSGDGTRGVWGGGAAPWGVYHTMEVYQKAQSAAGVADGVIKVWLNGVLIKHDTAVMIHDASTGFTDMRFDGLQFFSYWGGSGGYTKTVAPYDWLRWGEFYVSGK
jgi:hypothetical protein